MNIEECMNVEAIVDRKPWCDDIKAYIKDGEYLPGAMYSRRSLSGAWHANSS